MLLLGACSGGDDEEPATPEDALAGAKTKLDETSGVSLALTTDQLPDGVDALSEASGVGTHAPAFEGDIKVIYNGLSVEVPVIAVDGRVYAKLPSPPSTRRSSRTTTAHPTRPCSWTRPTASPPG